MATYEKRNAVLKAGTPIKKQTLPYTPGAALKKTPLSSGVNATKKANVASSVTASKKKAMAGDKVAQATANYNTARTNATKKANVTASAAKKAAIGKATGNTGSLSSALENYKTARMNTTKKR
jgi:hypothetical protein